MLPGLAETDTARAEQRLRAEREIWITTVRRDGQPQSSPVGFLWDGAEFLILSRPDSPKVRNLTGNPRLALHLDTDRSGADSGVLTLEGVAALDRAAVGADESAAYLARYEDVLRAAELTAESFFAEYSAVIRVRPTRARVQ